MKNNADDVFKLVFSTTGVLVDVEPPPNRKLRFGPAPISQLSFEQLRGQDITLPDGSKQSFEELLMVGNITVELTFLNVPGSSICGGDCGGRPFCWC